MDNLPIEPNKNSFTTNEEGIFTGGDLNSYISNTKSNPKHLSVQDKLQENPDLAFFFSDSTRGKVAQQDSLDKMYYDMTGQFLPTGLNEEEKKIMLEYERDTWDNWSNSATSFVKGATKGILEGVGSWDMRGAVETFFGDNTYRENEFSKWLNETPLGQWANKDEVAQSYRKGDHNVFDSEWWTMHSNSIGFTAGLALEMGTESLLLGGGLSMLGKATGITSTLNKVKNATVFGHGSIKGFQEAYMNAGETYESVKMDALEKGISEEEAIKMASRAASLHMKKEAGALMFLNGVQTSLLNGFAKTSAFKNNSGNFKLGFSDGIEDVFKRSTSKISKNKYLNKTTGFLAGAASEGVEEGIQSAFSINAYNKIVEEAGLYDLKKSYLSPEMGESVLLGFIGGGILSGLGKISKLTHNNSQIKILDNKRNKWIKETTVRTSKLFENIEKKQSEIKDLENKYINKEISDKDISEEDVKRYHDLQSEIEDSRNELMYNSVVSALHYDYLKGEGTTLYDTHVAQLKEELEAVKSGNMKKLQDLGLVIETEQGLKERSEGLLSSIQETHTEALYASENIKTLLENTLLDVTNDFNEALNITKKKFLLSQNTKIKEQLQSKLDELYNSDTELAKLSEEGLEKFKLERELASNENSSEDVREQYKSLKYSKEDKNALFNISKKKYDNIYNQIKDLDSTIEKQSKDVQDSSDKKTIKENIKNRRQGVINKAKTVQDVEEIKEDIGAEADKETSNILDKMAAAIKKKEKSSKVDQSGDKVEKRPVVNKNKVSEEEHEENTLLENNEEEIHEIPDEFLFSTRHQIKSDSSISDSQNERLLRFVSSKKARLGKDFNFENTITNLIESEGYDWTDTHFNAVVKAFDLAKEDFSNAEEIYNKYFEDDVSILEEITTDEVVQEAINEAINNSSKPVKYDLEGEPRKERIIGDEDNRTSDKRLKIAYSFTEQVRETGTYNYVRVNRNLSGDVFDILDPDLVNVGTELIVKPTENDSQDIIVEGKKTTWGNYKKNINQDSKEYISNIPIGIYNESGNLLGYVHSSNWYNDINISDRNNDQQEVIREGSENVYNLRKQILNSGIPNTIIITERSMGALDKISESNDTTPIKLNKATGNTEDFHIGVVRTDSSMQKNIFKDSKDLLDLGPNSKIINKEFLNKVPEAATIELRRVNINEKGISEYMALPTLNKQPFVDKPNLKEDLNPKLYNTAKFTVLSHMVLKNLNKPDVLKSILEKYNFTVSQAQTVQKAILDSTGLDIKNYQNTSEFLGYFFDERGNKYHLKNKIEIKMFPSKPGDFENIYGENGLILKSNFNINHKMLSNTVIDNIPLFDSTGKVSETFDTYKDLVKEFTYTNIISHQYTNSKGETKWVTDVQPKIIYELKEEVLEETPVFETAEVKQVEPVNEEIKSELSQDQLELIKALREAGDVGLDTNLFSSRRELSLDSSDVLASSIFEERVTGFKDEQYIPLLESLIGNFVGSLDFNSIKLSEVSNKLNTYLEDTLQPIIGNFKTQKDNFSKFPELQDVVKNLEDRIFLLENIIKEKEKLVGPKAILSESIAMFLEQDLDAFEQDFNKSAEEKDIKLSYSGKIKLFLSSFPLKRKGTEQIVSNKITLLPEFNNPDQVDLILKSITTEIPSDINILLDKLKNLSDKKNSNPIYKQLHEKIKNVPVDIQNEILYKTVSSKFTAHKLLYYETKDKNGNTTYEVKVIDENSSRQELRLSLDTKNNFIYDTILTKTQNDKRILNIEESRKYLTRLESFKNVLENSLIDKDKVSQFKNILETAGLYLSDNTLEQYLIVNNPFSNNGILKYMESQLIKMVDDSDLNILETNIYDEAGKALKDIIGLEIQLNGSDVSRSIRVGDKTLQGVIQNTSVYNHLKELKDSSNPTLSNMLDMGYTKNNYILNLIKDSSSFKQGLEISFASPDSIKVNGKKNDYSNTEFDKVSDVDGIVRDFGVYTYDKHDKLAKADGIAKGLNFRYGQMPFMTLSDKGRMTYLKTALLDLRGTNHITIDNNSDIKLSNQLLDFITSQIFESEYNRILDAYKNPSQNINSFDTASKLFLFLPRLNTLEVGGVNIHQLIKDNKAMPNKELIYQAVYPYITEYVNSEVNQKLNKEGEGILKDTDLFIKGKLKKVSTEYLNSFKGNDISKARKFVAEHTINNLLHQANLYQIFLGDLAYYTKKGTKNILDENGYVIPEIVSKNYLEIAQSMGEVVNKRSASLIAPGFVPANFYNKKHLQIQLNDVESVSENIGYYIEVTKGSSLTQEEKDIIAELKQGNSSRVDRLQELNPQVSDYFNMEGTDAQEYTTWKTHIQMLFGQGKLTEDQKELLQSAYNKMSEGKFDEVSEEELSFVMQPVKPVYTGFINQNGVSMRPMYIKSSSFPLLPQVTKNLKLDNLRKNLEALESDDVTVRASYQTANKIGSNKTLLSPDMLYNNTPEQLTNLVDEKTGMNVLQSASVILDSKNFKLQQETPDKTSKNVKKNMEDYIHMGSQFFKILGGNGIFDAGNVFKNVFNPEILELAGINKSKDENLNGEDLRKIEFEVYRKYSNTKTELLYDKLDLDKTIPFKDFTIAEKKKTLDKLVDFLKLEIKKRDYPKHLVDALQIVEDVNGVPELKSSLFLDPNSNKFEALLQSIVSKEIAIHKLPGYGHYAASSEGFETISEMQNLSQTDKSGIIWTTPHKGKLKATYADGQLKEAEVLVKSHYRIGGKLVDLSSDEYSKMSEDGKYRTLRLDKIDEELLSNFSFRIPTSSHQSGAILKVVGFLPKESGDMLVVPADHTIQIGEDFDIDKRNLYKSNYVVDNTGIRKLNKSHFNSNKDLTQSLVDGLFESIAVDQFDSTDPFFQSKLEKEFNIKLYENAMIDMYKSVYQSTNNDIQSKIFKPLVTDVAEDTANMIVDVLDDTNNLNFSILSDTYQRKLLKAGADGKGGIGVSSNAVTLQAQFEKLSDKSFLTHLEYSTEQKTMVPVRSEEMIGGLRSNGVLGERKANGYKSIDGARDVADQLGENQNVNTDNVNKQIMAKRNENSYTMAVFNHMAMRGFDLSKDAIKGSKRHIPSLFMSQPIIRRYVDIISSKESITGTFEFDKEQETVKQLLEEYGYPKDLIKGEIKLTDFLEKGQYDNMSRKLTGQFLYDNLKENVAKEIYPVEQLVILQKFMRFKFEAKELADVRDITNIPTAGGLGVSYFNTIDRINKLNTLPESNVFNAYKLIGDYQESFSDEEDLQLEKEGYVKIGRYHWKPETTQGFQVINTLKMSQDLMSPIFEYDSTTVSEIFNKISLQKSTLSLKDKYDVMRELKDYINSSIKGITFEGNINEERRRLFFDNEQNISLASIIKHLKTTKHPLAENSFIKNLQPTIKYKTEPSSIIYVKNHNSVLSTFGDYDSFQRLFTDNKTIIGTFNGVEMTPQMLGQDLVSYSMLANSQNGATGFSTLLPVNYLNHIEYYSNVKNNFKDLDIDKFVTQYYQHNPNKAVIISSNNYVHNLNIEGIKIPKENPNIESIFKNVKEFSFVKQSDDQIVPQYISIRNTNKEGDKNKLFNLYKYDSISGKYVVIPTLGTSLMNEYNNEVGLQDTLLPKAELYHNKTTSGTITYKDSGINKIAKIPFIEDRLPEKDGIKGILNKYLDSPGLSKENRSFIENLLQYGDLSTRVVYTNPPNNIYGVYNRDADEIYIRPDLFARLLEDNNNDWSKVRDIAREIILEEIIHSMTVKQFDQYVKSSNPVTGEITLSDNAPLFATKLLSLYNTAKESLPYDKNDLSTYYSKNIYEFMAGMFVAPDYRQALEKSNPGLLKKFLDMLKSMLGNLYKQSTGKVLSYKEETFNAVYDLLKDSRSVQESKIKEKDWADGLSNNNIMKDMIRKDKARSEYYKKKFEGYNSRQEIKGLDKILEKYKHCK